MGGNLRRLAEVCVFLEKHEDLTPYMHYGGDHRAIFYSFDFEAYVSLCEIPPTEIFFTSSRDPRHFVFHFGLHPISEKRGLSRSSCIRAGDHGGLSA
jgi:hypothetical protein